MCVAHTWFIVRVMVLTFIINVRKNFDYRCSELKEDVDCEEGDDVENDEDGSFSWLKEMGVQDKVKKPDSITIQLYPSADTVSCPVFLSHSQEL